MYKTNEILKVNGVVLPLSFVTQLIPSQSYHGALCFGIPIATVACY